jgi:hypothetical protein
LEEAVAGLLRRRILELLPPTPRGPTEAIRPAKLSPDHWIHCRHTPEWSGSCRGHMAAKAATCAPPPARRHHLRSTSAAPSPSFTDISDAPALHHLRAQPPLRDCRCRTRPPSPGPTALRHEEGGGRGSSRGPSASQAAHTASCAPPIAPPPPTSCHRARSPHQPPPDPEGRRGKREQPRPNGLPGCPHTLHPPRCLRCPAATEGDRRADQPLQPEGETEEGRAAEANGGPPRLLSARHAATATPRAATGRARTDAHCR